MTQNINAKKPLLPLEYCTVPRAARLLNCEEEDIYHWHDIGAIQLAVKLPPRRFHASFRVFITEDTQSLGTIQQLEDFRKEQIENHFLLIDGHYSRAVCHSKNWGEPYEEDDNWIQRGNNILDFIGYDCSGLMSGFWGIDTFSTTDEAISLQSFVYDPLICQKDKHKTKFGVSAELARTDDEWEDLHYVMRPDLVKLNDAISIGLQLGNRFTNQKSQYLMPTDGLLSDLQAHHRMSKPQNVLIRACARKILGKIDPHPSTSASNLLNAVAEHIDVYEELPSVRSVTRYLEE